MTRGRGCPDRADDKERVKRNRKGDFSILSNLTRHPFLLPGGWPAVLLCVVFLLSGCQRPIAREWRQKTDRQIQYAAVAEDPSAYTGSFVLWGGTILEVRAIPGGTELLIEEMPLNFRERPSAGVARGVFLGKTSRELSPASYEPGRIITLAGQVVGEEARTLGAMNYVFPVVSIKQDYLWEEKITVRPQHPYGWNWGAYGPFTPPLEEEWTHPDEEQDELMVPLSP